MPSVDVIIPTTRPSVHTLLESLDWGTRIADSILVVSNEVSAVSDRVSTVRFSSTVQPIGNGDAGLRRNIGADLSEADILVFLDDDLIAPVDMLGMAVEITERDGFCWGHHRFIDFSTFEGLDWSLVLDMDPELGRTRESVVNFWHGWQSSYAGLFAIRRDLFWDLGGFDLAYLGHHGSEDQQLGRRLSLRGDHPGRTFVHEPPFAWHPNVDGFHSEPVTNIMGAHQLVQVTVNGHRFSKCETCPRRKPVDVAGLTMSETVVIPYRREDFQLQKETI